MTDKLRDAKHVHLSQRWMCAPPHQLSGGNPWEIAVPLRGIALRTRETYFHHHIKHWKKRSRPLFGKYRLLLVMRRELI